MTTQALTKITVRCRNPLCPKTVHSQGRKRQRVGDLVVPEGVTVTTINQCRSCKQVQAVDVTG